MGGEQYPKETLCKVATIIMGQSPPGSTYNEAGEGVPFYQGVRDFGDRHPSRRVYCTAPTRFAEPEDILFSVRAPIGEVNRAIEHCSIGRGLAVIRGERVLDTTFLEYVLRNIKREWNILEGQGAVFGNAKKSDLENLMVPWPMECERHAIAHILGSLDDKIELNRRMNETLEAMARAIFKSWFIDFNPVRAKAAGRDTGLPKEISDLFPDSFEDSDLGEIPKGWEVRPLSDVIEVNPKRKLKKGDVAPYLDMKSMPTSSVRPCGWYDREFNSGTKFINGDTLLARITPCLENGKTAFVDFLEDGQVGWGSTEYIVLRSKPPLPVEYSYLLARSDRFRENAILNMTGSSGRQRVPASCLDNFKVVVPPNDIAALFGEVVKGKLSFIKNNDEQSKTLAAIRDTLLPKLISGELRVKDAESFLRRID